MLHSVHTSGLPACRKSANLGTRIIVQKPRGLYMNNECVSVRAKTAEMASSMTISSSPIEAVDIAGEDDLSHRMEHQLQRKLDGREDTTLTPVTE